MKAKKKYNTGGILPPVIKRLKKKAAKKKVEKSKPSYRGVTDEVTVTAKAPAEWEKKAAQAFVDSNSSSRVSSYAKSAVANVNKYDAGKEIKDKAYKLKNDTAKRLGVKNKANVYNSGIVKRSWNKALSKAGYRK